MQGKKSVALAAVLAIIAVLVFVKLQAGRVTPADGAPEVAAAGAPAAESAPTSSSSGPAESKPRPPSPSPAAESGKSLPTMLELGSVGCKPCEYMAPIIEALEKELAGKVVVRFHDVAKRPELAERYQIMTIPTQVFLDANGKELFRHIGVYEKTEILAKMKELGMLKE